MEKLKTETMLYALKQIQDKKPEDGINLKDIQESIYQLEDMVAGKTFLKSKSKNQKYVNNNVHIRLKDIVDLIKMKLELAEYFDYSRKPEIALVSESGHKINTNLSINYTVPHTQVAVDTISNQRSYASSYLVKNLITILLPYVTKGDFDDCQEKFGWEIKRRNKLELEKEDLLSKAKV